MVTSAALPTVPGQLRASPRPGRRRSPFGGLRPAMALAAVYGAAALVWGSFGSQLPGGRWLAVHLFTLGVLTNLVVALGHHFAQTLLHSPERRRGWRLVAVNGGALGVLTGLPSGRPWLVAVGASVLIAAVLWLYVDLRGMRRRSLTGRFAFVVRAYERAASAFLHGALLGGLLGAGVLTGGWYAAGRLAHLHVNVLGWGGLTLLATVVFFGPTIMRARMEAGADAVAAKAIRRAATGLTVAAFALLLTGMGGMLVVPFRLVAAAGLGVYAQAAVAVCLPVIRTGRRAQPTAANRMLRGSCWWFPAVVAADAVVVATGAFGLLGALGAAMLIGVLGQAILAAVGYVVPMASAEGADARGAALERMGRLPLLRPLALNAGVALVTVGAAVSGDAADLLARVGWLLVAAAVAVHLGLLAVTMVGDGAGARRSTAGG